ncbi:hypothetical protein ANOM_005224 [Aspergillus nomiae NRRL 13137]|uniref:Uncharacterized protein n=1 Tax=Aspergillus nomiae NRRL (strain ATCC 15546 / NRRL 13137 / CBS 260.88 / M93) TaxID=1509407 RepID=A0A0L1J4G9_ASPN3|nr:uncharacterized protein ANOM_005224 [Aspergillus nomiae NRRL 13137]KNG86323.1 hypothetical protein ANOM_005224 [Aspergillus nomiae NRRL 13137]
MAGSQTIETDVLIVGSGPIGATYARKLVESGLEVKMVEAGAQKNTRASQKDTDSSGIQGGFPLTSVPTNSPFGNDSAPFSFPSKTQMINGPDAGPKVSENAASRNVGGSSTRWACATARPNIEARSDMYTPDEWNELLKEAEGYIGTSLPGPSYVLKDSIRQHLLLDHLSGVLPDRDPQALPIAAKIDPKDSKLLLWSSAYTVLERILEDKELNKRFELLPEHLCTKLEIDSADKRIQYATVKDLVNNKTIHVKAKAFVICGGSVQTPQLLYASGFRPEQAPGKQLLPALGHFLTANPRTFCQVVLRKDLINKVEQNEAWKEKVKAHKENTGDPLPIPFHDFDPQITLKVDKTKSWHVQIHGDDISSSSAPTGVDKRVTVDLRCFGPMEPQKDNRVTFQEDLTDMYGMPYPIFHQLETSENDRSISHQMMEDMIEVAGKLGAYLPSAEPRFLPPEPALYACGTTRAGKSTESTKTGEVPEDSCCDESCKVWGLDNLYLGGPNVIPGATPANPILTAMCFAIKSANAIIESLRHS